MKKTETIQVLTLLASNYKSIDEKLSDSEKSKLFIEVWHECLADLDYKMCLFAVKKAIMSSSYPPTIHDIRKSANSIVSSKESDLAIDYWNEAYKMIKRGSYMSEDEFNKHSDAVKKFFGSVSQVKELALTDLDTISTVTKGQFLKQIEFIQAREKEMELLPAKMRETINKIKEEQVIRYKEIGENIG